MNGRVGESCPPSNGAGGRRTDPLSGTQLGPTLEGAGARQPGPAGGSVAMKITDANARLEAQVGIQTWLIVPIGILIAIVWLPPFIALFSRG